MPTQKRLGPIILTIAAAIASFLLTRVIWPDLPSMAAPTAGQMPFFIGMNIIECLSFGIGLSFLFYGWKFIRGRSTGDWLVFLAVTWGLVSWWPHDSLHRVSTEGDYNRLLHLEYGFHATLMICAIITASFLWKKWSSPN
jgi:hypothetical protein